MVAFDKAVVRLAEVVFTEVEADALDVTTLASFQNVREYYVSF